MQGNQRHSEGFDKLFFWGWESSEYILGCSPLPATFTSRIIFIYEHFKQMIPIKTFKNATVTGRGFLASQKGWFELMWFRCPRVEDIFDGRFYSCFNVLPLQPKRIVPFRAKCCCVWRGCIWIARTWPTAIFRNNEHGCFWKFERTMSAYITTIYTCIVYIKII